ncbi:MAG TPA: DUF4342 domain-containing protein [Ktedonosporobacter sp.]|nr:DUF4342 domain-containing protein [Ktedonosporobacter sp.]
MTQTDPNTSNVEQKPVYEELQVVGEQLLAKVKELLHEGNVRRIIIKQEGNTILELPLTVGVVGAVLLPQLAVIGTVAALVTKCSIEVVRSETPPTPPEETTY